MRSIDKILIFSLQEVFRTGSGLTSHDLHSRVEVDSHFTEPRYAADDNAVLTFLLEKGPIDRIVCLNLVRTRHVDLAVARRFIKIKAWVYVEQNNTQIPTTPPLSDTSEI